ncbi:hypothetical protein QC762_506365 [Podospora pseudocomata]|uniref:F-box domain-containing protein n=1 Tax=Podospora pseudocomata TaxID=2093779 RepID=A0ABR0GCL7_9PEZI|nr:hypothetical protein QC762_506365 [Podospora pseudocomata]
MTTTEQAAEMTPPPSSPSPTTTPTPTLSTLAPELLLHILEAIPSAATLSNFLRACPQAWRVYAKHSQLLLLRLARYRYGNPTLTADEIIAYRAPFDIPFMQRITNANRLTILTDCPGSLDHSRCQQVYLLMGGRQKEEWVQLPRWAEFVERWGRAWEGREERRVGRLTVKRVRFYGEMVRFVAGWERWMALGGQRGRGKVMEQETEMQCLEEHEEFWSRRGRGRRRRELEWAVTVQRRQVMLPFGGGGGAQKKGRGNNRVNREEKPVVKATVKKERKRKVKEEMGSGGNKRAKVEEGVAAGRSVQWNGDGQDVIELDSEDEPMIMRSARVKPLTMASARLEPYPEDEPLALNSVRIKLDPEDEEDQSPVIRSPRIKPDPDDEPVALSSIRIKPDLEDEPTPMSRSQTNPLPMFKLEEDDW